MARALVGLKVKVELHSSNGYAKYPDFNTLAVVVASGMDWSKYVDTRGDGWKYDNCCGHNDDEADSPHGMQWGMVLVPVDFAEQAAAAFPRVCELMTETECETFYNDRFAVRLPSIKRNEEVIKSLSNERTRLVRVSADTSKIDTELAKAEDPDDPASGAKRIKEKTWTGLKQKRAIEYVNPKANRTRIARVR